MGNCEFGTDNSVSDFIFSLKAYYYLFVNITRESVKNVLVQKYEKNSLPIFCTRKFSLSITFLHFKCLGQTFSEKINLDRCTDKQARYIVSLILCGTDPKNRNNSWFVPEDWQHETRKGD